MRRENCGKGHYKMMLTLSEKYEVWCLGGVQGRLTVGGGIGYEAVGVGSSRVLPGG